MWLQNLKKYLPTKEELQKQRLLRPIWPLLDHPELWHLHRQSTGNAAFIGVFCAWIPLPVQILFAALFALIARANLPIAVVTTFVSNPLTFGPMYYFAYKLGALLLGVEMTTTEEHVNLRWLVESFEAIWLPFVLGSLICASVSGLAASITARILWRTHTIRRWKERRLRIREQKNRVR